MPTFQDNADREWRLSLDAPKIKAVRESADPEFLKGEAVKTYQRLSSDPVTLCMVIAELCRSERDSRKLTDEQFYEGLAGDALDGATEALVGAINSFIPRSQRMLAEATAERNSQIREMGVKKALARINDPQLMEKVEAVFDSRMDDIINQALGQTRSMTVSDTQDS